MAGLYLTYGSVPELRALSKEDRIRVLRASAAAYARTSAFQWSEGLRIVLFLVLPIAAALIVYLVFNNVPIACLAMGIMLIIGKTLWFHCHVTQLRPFIREVLQGPIPDSSAPQAEQWRANPWYAGLFFGGFMGGAMLLTDERPWWVVLPLAAGVGLLFGIGMQFLRKRIRWP